MSNDTLLLLWLAGFSIVYWGVVYFFLRKKNNVCPECKGTGEREITHYVGEEGMKIEMDVPIVCYECDGSGKIKIEDNE